MRLQALINLLSVEQTGQEVRDAENNLGQTLDQKRGSLEQAMIDTAGAEPCEGCLY